MRSRIRFFVVAGALALGGGVLVLWQQTSRSAAVPTLEINPDRTSMPAAAPLATSRESTGPASVASRRSLGFSIRVMDEGGAPVSGAVASVQRTRARELRAEDLTEIARSDTSGMLWINTELPTTVDVLWAVRKPGFLPAVLWSHSTSLRESVVLLRACELQVETLNEGDKPIGEVSVLVSGETLPSNHAALSEARSVIPGVDAPLAIHKAWTDTAGRTVLTGLPAGTLNLLVWHRDYVAIDIPKTARVTLPTTAVQRIRMAPVLAAVGKVLGDVVVESGYQGPPGLDSGGRRGLGLVFLSGGLKRRFPGADLLAVFVKADSSTRVQGPQAPDHLVFNALLARRGWQQLKVPIRPIAETKEPAVLDVGSIAEDPTMGQIEIMVDPGDEFGAVTDRPALYLAPKGSVMPESMMKSVRISKSTLAVPSGEYEVQARDAIMRFALGEPREVRVVPGKNPAARVMLRHPLHCYRLDVRTSQGVPVSRGTLKVLHEGRQLATSARELTSVWLPEGQVQIQVKTTTGSGSSEVRVTREAPTERVISVTVQG